jgi:predicted TIM-barrel fold metal-dependent hydrolase
VQQATTDRAPPCAPPDRSPRVPRLQLPALACDCHAHVIGPHERYPLSPERVYTPQPCTTQDYEHLLAQLGVARAVLVQPSIYGSDNRLLLDALARDPSRYRGVAVAAESTGDEELRQWHAAGVRGLRVNLVDRHDKTPGLPLPQLRAMAERIAPLGWHLELLVHADEHVAQLPALADMAAPVVLGHFGYQATHDGTRNAGFRELLRLLPGGRVWIKLTGPYRITREPLPYPPTRDLALQLAQAGANRLVWGSDWPHVMLKGAMPNDAEFVDLLEGWLPDAALRRQVLADNPTVLYGFEEGSP